ncbi:hypothetical protein [Nocardia nova]|uniref:hypothetical protein n=1 Tax=Nocardia nova TaxID=37330 RepID=UPI0026CDA56A
MRADYVLEYEDDFPIAVVEAKRTSENEQTGIEQARRYAVLLDVPVAYATNGKVIYEIVVGGAIQTRIGFPTPEGLWERFYGQDPATSKLERAMLLAPFDQT